MNIGIIGQGFVGTAIYEGLKNYYKIYTYDIDENKCNSSLMDVLINCEIIFQCLPTPMSSNGECDLSIVEQSLRNINKKAPVLQDRPIVIIKSTVPPGTTERLNNENNNLNIIFSPEFLTEANSIEDFKNQTRIILGGERQGTNKLRIMFSKAFPKAHIIKTDSTYAEMIKYVTNNFLTVKVAFANEMYKVCERLRIDYDKVVEYATLDERLGHAHWGVPGPDGDLGFGGHCFPKDLSAMIELTKDLQTPNFVLRGAQDTNDELRKNRDWETMHGRAVIDEVEQ